MRDNIAYVACSRRMLKAYFVLFLCFAQHCAFGQKIISISDNSFPLEIGKQTAIFIDTNEIYNSSNIVLQNNFKLSDKSVPVFKLSNNNIWLKFSIKNFSHQSNLYFSIQYSNIAKIWLYERNSGNQLFLLNYTGNAEDFYTREDNNVNFNFRLFIPKNSVKNYYVKISSPHPLELPIVINNSYTVNKNAFSQNLIIGIYSGIIVSILLYNLFLFFATKDRSYFIYVIYLFTLGFAQITFAGWSFKFFWPHFPSVNAYIVTSTSCLAGLTGIAFAKAFLHTNFYTPKINKFLSFLIVCYLIAILLSILNFTSGGYSILNYNSLVGGITLLWLSIVILKKGYRPASFYLLAWSFFLLAIIVFVLRNLNILPTNNFTHYILYYGSAIEAILLSIALADRINQLRKEKDISQAEALKISRENEKLVLEQNIMLEQKVTDRTEALQTTNTQLNVALSNLKDTQTQLVDAEKMASLGQLTAGIAHEINNPINFVKSNINPLRLDFKELLDVLHEYNNLDKLKGEAEIKAKLAEIEALKQDIDIDFIQKEIQSLILGIEDGAERTAEIVRGLRTFSRIDESALKTVNIHDGIQSTLVILKNSMPYFIRLEKQFDANGNIECFPGKLNQVFMNIITNAIQSIKSKPQRSEEEAIYIYTKDINNTQIQISIKDTGIGMTDDVKHRIFEPFFTTKEVGEGTGLGMAIVFKIMQKHGGKIDIISAPHKGAEFIISLPHQHPVSDQL